MPRKKRNHSVRRGGEKKKETRKATGENKRRVVAHALPMAWRVVRGWKKR